MLDLFVLAVALAMDATAVAAGLGASAGSGRVLLGSALLFGLFQGGMSGLGWLGGAPLAAFAGAVDHWIAFGLLTWIGIQMVREGLEEGEEPADQSPLALVGLAVATSIDALAAGVSLPVLGTPAWLSVGVIAVVTTGLSLGGGLLGRRLGSRFGGRLEVAGGVLLVLIGARILFSHLWV